MTERAGVAGEGYSMGAAAGDYDNDGWAIFNVTGVNRNILYHNNHDGTFTDVTQKAGVTGVFGSKKALVGISCMDRLRQRWAAGSLCGELSRLVSGEFARLWSARQTAFLPPSMYKGEPNLLYHNNGDGRSRMFSAGKRNRKFHRERDGRRYCRL